MLKLSLVLPCFNVEKKIETHTVKTMRVLENSGLGNFELILVNDGSTDNTAKFLNKLKNNYKRRIKILSYPKNKGKGYALRYGFNKCKGEKVGFIDADGDINPKSLSSLLEVFKRENANIVVGSKNHPKSNVKLASYRKIVSFFSQKIVKVLFDIEVSDTQAGVKIFERKVLEVVIPYLHINGYAFDVEFLSIAKKLGFSKIYEAPIDVSQGSRKNLNFKDKVRFIKEIIKTVIEYLKVYRYVKTVG